jgi:hypothetical protein
MKPRSDSLQQGRLPMNTAALQELSVQAAKIVTEDLDS